MKRLALVTAFAILGGVAGPAARHVSTPRTSIVRTAIVTPSSCLLNSEAGHVRICHRTNSSSNPYVELRVAVDACMAGHGDHVEDFIAVNGSCEDVGGLSR